MKDPKSLVIEFMYFPGCPHAREALGVLGESIAHIAPGAVVREVEVRSDEAARDVGFLGSPSVRIEGLDMEGRSSGAPEVLSCRLYEGRGVPPRWMVEAALIRALGPRHVLFLCVGNSARSQLAEGVARHLAPPGVMVSSAGSQPAGVVSLHAIEVLGEIGIDISGHRSKGLDAVDLDRVEAVITLCAEEVCPAFPRPIPLAHWALDDPGFVPGDDASRLAAFRETRDEILGRLRVLFPGTGVPKAGT